MVPRSISSIRANLLNQVGCDTTNFCNANKLLFVVFHSSFIQVLMISSLQSFSCNSLPSQARCKLQSLYHKIKIIPRICNFLKKSIQICKSTVLQKSSYCHKLELHSLHSQSTCISFLSTSDFFSTKFVKFLNSSF